MALHPNLADTADCIAFPSFPIDEEADYNVEVTTFEDGITQSFKLNDFKKRRFKLKYEAQSDAEQASFKAFFDARFGAFSWFYWSNLRTGELDIKVRFVDTKVTYSVSSPRTWDWTCQLVVVA